MIGGVISLIVGLIFLAIGISLSWYSYVYVYYWLLYRNVAFLIGFWFIGAASVVIVSSYMIYVHPEQHRMWGITTLILSIIGGGGILGLMGGILAIIWKPSPKPIPRALAATLRICLKCGRVLRNDFKFCPYCGNKLE